jgi:hypothetical protein
MNQGNVKIIAPPVDLLDDVPTTSVEEIEVAPRFVVVANRQRTRAVAESVDFNNLIHPEDDPAYAQPQQSMDKQESMDGLASSAVIPVGSASTSSPYSGSKPEKRISTIGTAVLARWTKRRSNLAHMGQKLVKWARSITQYGGCTTNEAVHLDRHVHPPGHDDDDDRRRRKTTISAPAATQIATNDHAGWIDKEKGRAAVASTGMILVAPAGSTAANDVLGGSASNEAVLVNTNFEPRRTERTLSEDDPRFLS